MQGAMIRIVEAAQKNEQKCVMRGICDVFTRCIKNVKEGYTDAICAIL